MYYIDFLKMMCDGGYISHTFHFKKIKELHDICIKNRLWVCYRLNVCGSHSPQIHMLKPSP